MGSAAVVVVVGVAVVGAAAVEVVVSGATVVVVPPAPEAHEVKTNAISAVPTNTRPGISLCLMPKIVSPCSIRDQRPKSWARRASGRAVGWRGYLRSLSGNGPGSGRDRSRLRMTIAQMITAVVVTAAGSPSVAGVALAIFNKVWKIATMSRLARSYTNQARPLLLSGR